MTLPVASAPFANSTLNFAAPKHPIQAWRITVYVDNISIYIQNEEAVGQTCNGKQCHLVAICCNQRNTCCITELWFPFLGLKLRNTPDKIPWAIFSLQPGSGSFSFSPVGTVDPVCSFVGSRAIFSLRLMTSAPAPSGPCR